MSQVCRYYLRGSCNGSRCHFLHENADYSYKENYSGYSNANYHDKYYSSSNNYYNKNTSNYNKYHVDNRPQSHVAKSTSILSNDEIFEVMQRELNEFEKSHRWFFTVIAPLTDLGNIPGLEDLSPEELRYQYYESCSNNSLSEFAQNLHIAKNDVAHICRLFKTRSSDAFEIVKIMIQKQKGEGMSTDNRSAAASSFKFDLNALAKPPVYTHPVQTSDQQFSQMPVEDSGPVFSSDVSVAPSNFPTSQFGDTNFGSNSANNFGQPSAALNTFSFNLNNLQPSQNAPSVFQNSGPFGNPSSNTNPSTFNNSNSMFNSNNVASNPNVFNNLANVSATVENSVYSKPEEIPNDDLSAFQEKFFKIGRIPLNAPSKELCYN